MTFIFDATTPRFAKPPNVVTLHWTGGIGDAVAEPVDIERVKRVLRSRRCSVHFIVDTDGHVEQTASLDRRCVHAGKVNARSIGIEVISPGLPGDLRELEHQRGVAKGRPIDRAAYVANLRGRRVKVLDYTTEQTDAVTVLVERLCAELGVPQRVPLEADGSLVARQLTTRELTAFTGVIGHYHCHDTKLDPGTAPLERLRVRWGAPS